MATMNYLPNIVSLPLLLIVQQLSTVHCQNNAAVQSNACTTPKGTAGNCIAIHHCNELISQLVKQPLTNETRDYLRSSHCGFEDTTPKVCCPSGNESASSGNGNSHHPINVSPPKSEIFPEKCGDIPYDKIIGGQIADPEEFPWTVLLEYDTPQGKKTPCSGVLISNRYVLTAAHCLVNDDIPSTWNLTSVRLGEYNISSEKDCYSESESSTYCIDDPVTVNIQERVPHEDYEPLGTEKPHNIALLRLSQVVNVTDFIQPICLPANGSTTEIFVHVVGWRKGEDKSRSDVKLKHRMSIVNNTACNKLYEKFNVHLRPAQICAGGQTHLDSCRGDPGGPLMTREVTPDGPLLWTVIGVDSIGPEPCGILGRPNVYTRVVDYIPWILSKMRP